MVGFLLLSNTITDPIEAITVYRNKNSVEEAFNIVKNFLGHHRMRIHSNNAMISKFFIAFISLIMASHVHKVMEEKNLYSLFTMNELFEELNLIKSIKIKDKTIIYPLTSLQEELLKNFGCKLPND
jgi:transposase